MRLVKILSNRITVVSIALLAQLVVIATLALHFEDISPFVNIVIRIIGFVTVCFVINSKSEVSIKLTWIVFILLAPVFGSIMYVLTGGKRPRRRLIKALTKAEKANKPYRIEDKQAEKELKNYSESLYSQSVYLKKQGFNVVGNTSSEYFTSGEKAFPKMLKDLEKAEKFIFMEYFILQNGEMLERIMEILERKAKAGVEVRLIYDDVGSLFTLPYKFSRQIEKRGIKCIAFNPFVPFLSAIMNNRDHRKILVIDSRIAYTGGINIADEYINKKKKCGYWKDNVIRFEGDGALCYTIMFLDMWKAFRDKNESIEKYLPRAGKINTKGYVQPFYDTPLDDDTVGSDVYINAITGARHYIYIFTPYLICGQELMGALCLAAKRGVDVRIIVPGIPDKKSVYLLTKSHFAPLIDAGVKIYKFTKGFVHSKGFAADDRVAFCGSINLDFRSLHHHFECGCVLYNTNSVAAIKKDMLDTIAQSEQVQNKKRMFNGVITNTYHAILRLIAPLM